MREGSAEVVIACAKEAAFAWLADPHNAGEWFASVTLPESPVRPLRVGAVWRFGMTRQRGKIIPMRLMEYHPPQSFTWETAYPAWRDNLQWALALSSEPSSEPGATDATRLRLTIRQRPGPLGWPVLLLAALFARLSPSLASDIAARAERAAERAREALESLPTLTYGAYERHSQRNSQRSGKGGGRGGRRRGHAGG
jgi:hypothetical protein